MKLPLVGQPLHRHPRVMKLRPAIVVLAAGPGRRFQGAMHKLEQALADTSVLGATLRSVMQTQLPLVVVTTPALAPLAARWVAARDIVELGAGESARGVGWSIAVGVGARSDAPGWVMLPGDMPLVRPATMLAVAAALDLHPVAYAQHRGRGGQPVGFAGELYSELISLDGDEGTRRLVARYPACGVDVDDPGVLLGVDTERELAAVRAAHGGDGAAPRAGTAP